MILVTGGTGFLGSYLIRYLVRDGFPVRALRRSSSDLSLLGEAKDKVQWVEGDVLDVPSLEDAFEGVNQVYHSASIVSFDSSERKKMMKVNVEGTANVVNLSLAKGIKKLLYVSSSSALSKTVEWVDESLELEKNEIDTFYGISKFLGESEVWRGIAEGLNAVIVNPTLLLGAGRWSDSSVRIFEETAKGQLFYPTGSNGYADVRDAAKLMIRLMESQISGERFIITSENKSYSEVIFEIADRMAVKRPPFALKKWLVPVGRSFDWIRAKITGSKQIFTPEVARIILASAKYNNQKIRSAVDCKLTNVSETIEETVSKYKESKAAKIAYAVLDLT